MELYKSHNAKVLNLTEGSFLSESEDAPRKDKQTASGLIKIVHSNATNSPDRELKGLNDFDFNKLHQQLIGPGMDDGAGAAFDGDEFTPNSSMMESKSSNFDLKQLKASMFDQEETTSRMKQSKMKSQRMNLREKEDLRDKEEEDRNAAQEPERTGDESPGRSGMHEKTGSSIS